MCLRNSMKPILKYAIINSLGTAIYIVAVASFIFFGLDRVFGDEKTVFIPILMLLVLVFSAALTGILIFGRPAIWYLDGKKSEALFLLFYTLGALLIIIIIAIFLIFAFS